MEITLVTRNLRIAPRKLRLVTKAIVHKPAESAATILALTNKRGANLIAKAINSAVAVAADRNLDKSSVVIQRAFVNEGQRLKRYQGHSRGRISPVHKQYSHLCLVIQGEPKAASRRRTPKTEAADQEKKEGE